MQSMCIRIGILIGVSLAITACSSERPQEPPSAALDTGAANVVAGYAHAFSRSAFHIGSDTTQTRAGNVDKFVGSEGTFAVNRINGAVTATPHAGAASELAPPLTTNVNLHNETVRKYFTSAGLPPDQIGQIDIGSSMISSGRVGEANGRPRFLGYTSTVTRKVAGYPVVESVASARMNASSEVVHEHVYWPELPLSVVDDARALDALIHDPSRSRRYLAALPNQGADGRVVIHHKSSSELSSFEAKAYYDVLVNKVWHHFDIHGVEIRLPQEIGPLASTSQVVPESLR